MIESPKNQEGIPEEIKEYFTEAELRKMAEEDPLFAQTINDAFGTWNDFFAESFEKSFTQEEFTKNLIEHHHFIQFSPEELCKAENTLAKPELLGKSPEEAYPDASEKDISSLKRFIEEDISTPVILGRFGDSLIMLDGDHRAVAAAVKGKEIPAFIVDLDK